MRDGWVRDGAGMLAEYDPPKISPCKILKTSSSEDFILDDLIIRDLIMNMNLLNFLILIY